MRAFTVSVPQTPGRCRWCRCTYEAPCADGCWWVNRQQTLCSSCVPLDRALRSSAGRQELAEFLSQHGFLSRPNVNVNVHLDGKQIARAMTKRGRKLTTMADRRDQTWRDKRLPKTLHEFMAAARARGRDKRRRTRRSA